MANPINSFMDNTSLDHLNSLTHLIDHIDPDNEININIIICAILTVQIH